MVLQVPFDLEHSSCVYTDTFVEPEQMAYPEVTARCTEDPQADQAISYNYPKVGHEWF